MRVALFEPEIAGNVGAVLRLGACLGAAVDLIEPMGFAWDDRRVRRTAMDYIDHVELARHTGFGAFRGTIVGRRLVLFTTKAGGSAYEFAFAADDVLLFGKESAGVPDVVRDACDARVRLPMRPQVPEPFLKLDRLCESQLRAGILDLCAPLVDMEDGGF